jgi:hypothetical protein
MLMALWINSWLLQVSQDFCFLDELCKFLRAVVFAKLEHGNEDEVLEPVTRNIS